MSDAPLLQIRDLEVQFTTSAGVVRAVDGVSIDIPRGKTLAVVGESGSGKSVTAMSILRLAERQRGARTSGRIEFRGRDLLQLPDEELRKIRGNQIAMIFQEPMTSLNPVFTVGDQIGEAIALHRGLDAEATEAEVLRLLELVGIPSPAQRSREYPHQLSGGMRQRVMIAMALSCSPKLLIADEPTTALDVTIQAQILQLMHELQGRLGMSILLITHDLGVVASVAHEVVVMYAGRVVERASVEELFERPQHPYTAGLLASLPDTAQRLGYLTTIEGSVPDALSFPAGCRFHPRCRFQLERCRTEVPVLGARLTPSHLAACFHTQEHPGADLKRHLSLIPPGNSVEPRSGSSAATSGGRDT